MRTENVNKNFLSNDYSEDYKDPIVGATASSLWNTGGKQYWHMQKITKSQHDIVKGEADCVAGGLYNTQKYTVIWTHLQIQG